MTTEDYQNSRFEDTDRAPREGTKVRQESSEVHQPCSQAALPGKACPRCGKGVLDYDGLLVLRCEYCGFTESGGFT